METNKVEKLLFAMLTHSTGIHMMDSGGGEGRAWQRAQKLYPTIGAMQKSADVSWELMSEPSDTNDIDFAVNTFHYLKNVLELDELCDEYNRLKQADWDSDIYGVSTRGEKWLNAHNAEIGDSWNTYNGECTLDRTLQGTNVRFAGGVDDYVLLQVHGGADVRGGYTDAKLFKVSDGYINPTPEVYGEVDGVSVSTLYHGHKLGRDTDDNETQGEPVPVKTDSIISLSLSL